MKSIILAGLMFAMPVLSAPPAQAGFLDDLKAKYNQGCDVHGLSVTCTGKHESKFDVPNPFTSTSTGNAPTFNSKGVIGWWDAEGNIDLSHIIAPSGNLTYHDEFSCKTDKVTGKLIPPSVTKSSSTAPGHC